MREDDVRDVIESKLELLNKAGILDNICPDMLLDTLDTDEHWKKAVREFACIMIPLVSCHYYTYIL